MIFCAFEGPPRIVRLHGLGRGVLRDAAEFADVALHFPASTGVGVRAIIVVDVQRATDSCGYAVPFMEFESNRPTLDQWSLRKGLDGIRTYWAQKNRRSINDLEGID